MWWLLVWLILQSFLMMLERSIASLKCRSKVNISWDDTSIEKTKHAILDIIFSDRWWIRKWIIPEVLGQDPLRKEYFIWPSGSYSQFL